MMRHFWLLVSGGSFGVGLTVYFLDLVTFHDLNISVSTATETYLFASVILFEIFGFIFLICFHLSGMSSGKSLWYFAMVLLSGIGILVLGFAIASVGYSNFLLHLLADPNAYSPPCILGYTRGCLTWPITSLFLSGFGGMLALIGFIGIVESRFPR